MYVLAFGTKMSSVWKKNQTNICAHVPNSYFIILCTIKTILFAKKNRAQKIENLPSYRGLKKYLFFSKTVFPTMLIYYYVTAN